VFHYTRIGIGVLDMMKKITSLMYTDTFARAT